MDNKTTSQKVKDIISITRDMVIIISFLTTLYFVLFVPEDQYYYENENTPIENTGINV